MLTVRGRAYTLAFFVADDDPGALTAVRFLIGLQEDIGPGCTGVAVQEASVGGDTDVMDFTLGVCFLQGVGAQGVGSRVFGCADAFDRTAVAMGSLAFPVKIVITMSTVGVHILQAADFVIGNPDRQGHGHKGFDPSSQLGVGGQILIIGVAAGHVELVPKFIGRLKRARTDRDQFGLRKNVVLADFLEDGGSHAIVPVE